MKTTIKFENGHKYNDVNVIVEKPSLDNDRFEALVNFFQENLERENAIVCVYSTFAFKDKLGKIYWGVFYPEVSEKLEGKSYRPILINLKESMIRTDYNEDIRYNLDIVTSVIDDLVKCYVEDSNDDTVMLEASINEAYQERYVLDLDNDRYNEFLSMVDFDKVQQKALKYA